MPAKKNISTPPPPPNDASPPWTVKRLLEWTTDYFMRGGLESARLDAEVLLAHALGEDRLTLYLNYSEKVPDDTLRSYRDLVRRRRDFEPVAYLTGTREFYSLPFSVSPSVLIPRPETEHLVEYALRFVQGHPDRVPSPTLRVLDIGTGSGNITMALAKHLPQARFVSVDICGDALGVAKENLSALPELKDRVSLIRGDLLEWLRPAGNGFDLIVSNPPYVTTGDWAGLSREVREYEPRKALDAGSRGTEIQERILADAAAVLKKGGGLLMEIGADQETPLRKALETLGLYEHVRIYPDYAGRPRILEVCQSALSSAQQDPGG